jgi:hypothetical protein
MTRSRFAFAGLLGEHVQVDHGPTVSPDGEIVWQVVISLQVPAFGDEGDGKLTDVWSVPADATEDDLAAGIVARTLALLAHETIEALRWNGEPVFDAHPSRSIAANEGTARTGASSVAEAVALRPWATP